ncbi:uncharacterized protein LOC121268016 isoform X1 [Juglans microcarpa x Juglans regia]|uniref:uncharacterized protein LOC121268016 isoform X1 n=2 Tax=Juglans microcarpa x Juglans regia TaxID=2249226 RepID=UPI001B7E4BE7|nr:uncharacterized protein LOC121268016 isoform X1 [Juglans microcarpa x Juglans regia]
MSSQLIPRPQSSNRRQPLLTTQASSGGCRLAEVAGGTTAECAAVCCCCPCGLVNLLYLAIYKFPAGLCRTMRKKRRQHLVKKGLLPPRRRRCSCGIDETGKQIHPVVAVDGLMLEMKSAQTEESEREVMKLEKEMWEKFYSTGFWRSPSQRESSPQRWFLLFWDSVRYT